MLRDGIQSHGIVWLIDSVNAITETIAQAGYRPRDIDALEIVIKEYLDERYPTRKAG